MFDKRAKEQLLAAAKDFATKFKAYDKELIKAESTYLETENDKEYDRLEKIGDRVYDILRKGGLSY